MLAGERKDIPVALPKDARPPGSHTFELWTRAALSSHLLVLPVWRRNGGSGAEHPPSTLARAELGYPCGYWLCVSGAVSDSALCVPAS